MAGSWTGHLHPAVSATLAAALILVAGTAARAQSGSVTRPVRGRAIDARTGLPVVGATVVLTRGPDTVARATTDSSGSFSALVQDSAALIAHFRWVGYRPDSIATVPSTDLPMRVAMEPLETRSAARLAPVRVAAEASAGFERRARRNAGGYFIRRADIDKKKPLRTAELFRSIPGVALADSAGVLQIISLRGYRRAQPAPTVTARSRPATVIGGDTITAPQSAGERCAIRVGIDGKLQDPTFSVNDVRPEEIEGIEAYMGVATIPIEFSTVQRNAICGLIMIWTRVGSGTATGS